MQRLISEKLRILMINQEDSGTRREILKQALYFARLLLSLQRHSSPSDLWPNKEAFLAPFRETEIWKISPQADGENQSLRGVVSIQLLDVLYTPKA